jgi:superfamily II DNA or RNA helicase
VAIQLFEHNLQAYNAALAMMEKTGKAAVIHPTGTGKSYIAFRLAEDHPQSHVVWLSPSEYIFQTQLENLRKDDPNTDFENITFLTYARLIRFNKGEIVQLAPKYIILDEFHRCGAQQWGAGVARLLNAFPHAMILGLSATNIRYLDNQRDMADELFDGNIASEITLGEAIVRGILPAPRYIETVYSYSDELKQYRKRVESISEKPIRDLNRKYWEALRRAVEKADGLDKIFTHYMNKKSGKYLVFCSDAGHMREMVNHVPEWFSNIDPTPHVYTAYSDDPGTNRDFASFKSDESDHLKLLFCIDMLNEGIHIDGISGVILFRPTVSPIIYKQQIGRALTSGMGSTPLIFDIVNNFENLCSIGAIEEEMRTAIQRMYAAGEESQIVHQHFRVFGQVRSCQKLFKQLQNSLSASWDQHYIAAKEYYKKHGDLNIPRRYKTSTGLNLGNWLNTQRRVRAGKIHGRLTDRQIAQLDEIGMIWENRLEISWDRNFQAAQNYFKTYGNLEVPINYCTSEGFALGAWISNLRQKRKNREISNLLNGERIQQLDSIGMIWDVVSVKWESNYAVAAQYFANHGDLHVPVKYVAPNGFALGRWIRGLRRARAGKGYARVPTAEEIHKLDAIGMFWGNQFEDNWMHSYQAAERFFTQHGNLNVPVTYMSPEGIALGKWIARQRYAMEKPDKSNNRLTPQRIQLLNKIGMIWEKDDPWEHRYQLAQEYLKRYGDLNIPAQYKTEDGIWLGKWLYRQKLILQGKEPKKQLSAVQREKLFDLGIK